MKSLACDTIVQPKLVPVPETNEYKLLEDYPFAAAGAEHTIKAGFIFNGASVPWLGWVPTYTPFHPDVMAAAIVHDYLYANRHVYRKQADQLFYDRLVLNGAPKIKAGLMYWAVRIAGGFYFKKGG